MNKKPTAVLVHGFNVSDRGEGSTDMLSPSLRKGGFDVLEADYGHLDLFGVRTCNRHIAHIIARMAPRGSVGIGHSNGCTILQQVSHIDFNRLSGLVLINPALDASARFGRNIDFVHVYSSKTDYVVKLSSYLVGHDWGAMGQVGYTGDDDRVINFTLPYPGHMGIFENFEDDYADVMVSRVKRTIGYTSM